VIILLKKTHPLDFAHWFFSGYVFFWASGI